MLPADSIGHFCHLVLDFMILINSFSFSLLFLAEAPHSLYRCTTLHPYIQFPVTSYPCILLTPLRLQGSGGSTQVSSGHPVTEWTHYGVELGYLYYNK